jgi:hypothetical protein
MVNIIFFSRVTIWFQALWGIGDPIRGRGKKGGGKRKRSSDKSGKLCQMLRPVQTAGSTRARRRAWMESFDSEHCVREVHKKLLKSS